MERVDDPAVSIEPAVTIRVLTYLALYPAKGILNANSLGARRA